MIVVSNSTPLIHLGRASKLHFLKQLYQRIYIPQEVWNDLMTPVAERWEDLPADVPKIRQAREGGWLVIQDPREASSLELVAELSVELGMGESFAMALAQELGADFLLVNDRGAIDRAEELGIKTKWVSEILHDALAANLLSDVAEYEQLLYSLRDRGLWITTSLMTEAIERAQAIDQSRKSEGSEPGA